MTVRARLLMICAAALVFIGCSGSDDPVAESGSEPTSCEQSAQQVVDRFEQFLEPYADSNPEEFLADPDLDGLDGFQNDIAELIVGVATDPNDDCTEQDLESEVDRALQSYAGEGLLEQYLVGAVRDGLAVERRDIAVTPDDDLVDLLPLLGPGSTITFSEGTFALDASVLVQSDLLLVGAGRDATVIESSAESAAIAVLGAGNLVMNDLSVRHVGELPASVVLVIDASIELVRVGLSGGIVDAEGGGGSGLVLTEAEPKPDVGVAIDDAVIAANGAAGVAVTGTYAPTILNSSIEGNEQCGICFFDGSAGQIQSNTFTGNGVGLQSSDSSAPEISGNSMVDNLVAGVLVEGDSTALLVENMFEGVDIVGIDVQDAAAPVVQGNTFGAHAVSLSLRGASTATASANSMEGGDIGILVGGTATPIVFDNEVSGTAISALLHGEESAGEFTGNTAVPDGGAGIVVEGSASPLHRNLTVDGGLVGAVFRQDADAQLLDSVFNDQQVGLETSENAVVRIEGNTFARTTDAAAIIGSAGASVVRDNRFEEPVAIGIQAGGSGEPTIEGNIVAGGDTGILVTESSAAEILGNMLTGQNFGIGVSGTAQPRIEDNEIVDAAAGAISFEDAAGGVVRGNRILDAGVVGIRVAGTASPSLEANEIFAAVAAPTPTGDPASDEAVDDAAADEESEAEDADGEAADEESEAEDADAEASDQETADEPAGSGAGLLFADSATGSATENELFGFVIGIQVSDAASPDLTSNRVDGAGVGGVGILYGLDASGRAEDNLSINQQLGFQLSGDAAPSLLANRIENASVAAFLIQGASVAELDGNECTDVANGIVVLEDAVPDLGTNECALAQ